MLPDELQIINMIAIKTIFFPVKEKLIIQLIECKSFIIQLHTSY